MEQLDRANAIQELATRILEERSDIEDKSELRSTPEGMGDFLPSGLPNCEKLLDELSASSTTSHIHQEIGAYCQSLLTMLPTTNISTLPKFDEKQKAPTNASAYPSRGNIFGSNLEDDIDTNEDNIVEDAGAGDMSRVLDPTETMEGILASGETEQETKEASPRLPLTGMPPRKNNVLDSTLTTELLDICKVIADSTIPPNTNFDLAYFVTTQYRLGKIVIRDTRASKPSPGSMLLDGYNMTALDDNWYHIRKLLQAITHLFDDDKEVSKNVQDAESHLLSCLSILATTADPMLWMFCGEHVVEGLQDACKAWPGFLGDNMSEATREKHTAFSKAIDEIYLLVQGCNVCAIAVRFPTKKGERLVEQWYRQLYQHIPECAYEECTTSLPHSDTLRSFSHISGKFSIGVYIPCIRQRIQGRKRKDEDQCVVITAYSGTQR